MNMVEVCSSFLSIPAPIGLPLAGYAGPPRHCSSLHSSLEANLIVFFCENTVLAFLSLDTLFAGPQLNEAVFQIAKQHLGETCTLQLFCSHTHFSPMLDENKPVLGAVDAGFFASVLKACDDLFVNALKSRKRIESHSKQTIVGNHGVNRRLTMKWPDRKNYFAVKLQTFMSPNLNGPVDNSIRCLLLRDEKQKVVAAILQVACHPTSFPLKNSISSEYIGPMRSVMREQLGLQLPIVFLQGFSGDVRPNLSGRFNLRSIASYLLNGPSIIPVNEAQWNGWVKGICDNVVKILNQPQDWSPLSSEVIIQRHPIPLAEVLDLPESEKSLVLTKIDFGDMLHIATVNAELFANWLEFFPEAFFTASCANEGLCYLPRESDVANGGYEVYGFMEKFSLASKKWLAGYEAKILKAWGLEGRK